MTKVFRHTSVLFMVAVIGLAAIGAGYALWFQVLTLNATVTTGELNVEWSDHGVQETYSIDQGDTFINEGDPIFIPAKAVQTCKQTLDDTHHVITINDGGLYPFAGCRHRIDIHNNGTVPVHVDLSQLDLSAVKCTPPAGGSCDPAADITVKIDIASCTLDNTGPNSPPNFPDPLRPTLVQLHPSNIVICDVLIYANQSASENTSYSGGIKILACQWNEDANCTFANTGGRENNETPTPTPTPPII